MPSINTKLTSLLGIKSPIVGAPMAGASGGALAAQVTLGGGFGFIGVGYESLEKVRKEISIARSLLRVEGDAGLAIGMGFLVWQLEQSETAAAELLSIAVENKVQAIWFSFGNDIGRWVKHIRESEKILNSDNPITIFIQVSSVEEALLAKNEWGADVLVAQGIESGGHGANYALPLLTLVPLILSATSPGGPPVLAAGGLATGAQVASLLSLGASGVVIGTRLLLSPESLYNDNQRDALLHASSAQSVRTMAFDHARNTLGWPKGVDGRGLRNETVEDYKNDIDVDTLRARFAEGLRAGDTKRIIVWAGSSVGLMEKISPAKEIIEELHQECINSIRACSGQVF